MGEAINIKCWTSKDGREHRLAKETTRTQFEVARGLMENRGDGRNLTRALPHGKGPLNMGLYSSTLRKAGQCKLLDSDSQMDGWQLSTQPSAPDLGSIGV